jgi:hypothetical protein
MRGLGAHRSSLGRRAFGVGAGGDAGKSGEAKSSYSEPGDGGSGCRDLDQPKEYYHSKQAHTVLENSGYLLASS